MRKGRFIVIAFVIVIIGTAGLLFLKSIKASKEKVEMIASSSYDVIDEAMHIIRDEGVHPVKETALIEGALRGMADVIDDPYSTYLSEEEASAHRESLASERVGIGAEITRSNGRFIIVAPLKSSPADKAGLLPYDEIIRVDGENVSGFSLQQLVEKMRGKEGSTLQLTIYRPERNKHLEVDVVREKIAMKTVTNEVLHVKNRHIGYITMTSFAEETGKEWKEATDAVLGNRAEGIVIDVRGNPGGYLHSVSEIVSSLVAEETIFAFMEDADGALAPLYAENSHDNHFNEKLKKIPLVILQDEGSASASEVLSGALQEIGRSIVIGTNSFGKGTVQDTFNLSNGGEMKLSTHKWLTPKEKWIHGKGIAPNIEVEANPLHHEHVRLVAETYTQGDFHDDVAYVQRVLKNLGYEIQREDGYFDAATESAIQAFQVDEELDENDKMDRAFFKALKEVVEKFKEDQEKDKALQMGLDYLVHELKN